MLHRKWARRCPNGRRIAAAASAAVTLIGLLAACGSESPQSAGGEGTKEFTYWTLWTQDEPVAKVLQKAITAFEKDTGVTVHVQWQGRKIMTKVKAALNTDDVPDLIDGKFPDIQATLGPNDQALDMASVYQMEVYGESGKTIRDVIPAKYDAIDTMDGKQIMVPYDMSANSWWFNATKYPQYVTSPPQTWDDLVSEMAAIKAAGHNPLAQDSDIVPYNATLVYGALERALGPGNVNKLAADHSGKGWDSPDVAKVIEAIANLAAKNYYIPGYDSSKYPAMEKDWAAGKAAFLYMGSWVPYYDGPDLAEDFTLGTFNFPTLVGTDTSLPATAYGWAIPAKAKNSPAAQKFITYTLNTKWMTALSQEAEILTPREDIEVPDSLKALQSLFVNNDLYPINDNVTADYPDLDQRWGPLFQGLITGKLSAAEFIAQAKQAQVQYWKLKG
jgi:raffinose/stachyose/melibiose transport system substrate-binding protein